MHSSEGHEPNLTPILDMVFQLITFFMLVMNFKAASLDMNLKLPVIGSARPVDDKGIGEILVLNVDSEGKLRVYGEPREDIDGYIAQEAQAAQLASRAANPDLDASKDLPTTIVVRADRNTPFHALNRVIQACQSQGFRKFHYRAVNAEVES